MTTKKIINMDLDGTLADLYSVNNWLDYLIAGNPRPYIVAKPLLNMGTLAKLLNKLQKNGYEINIISWLSKASTPKYDEMVTNAKLKWLKKHLGSVKFDNIHIVPYGTPKHTLSSGILFDDEEKNRAQWGAGAYDINNIIGVLKGLA